MDIETLTKLTKDWMDGTVSDLFCFDEDTHEAWLGHAGITIEKFSKGGLIEPNYRTGKFKLTQTGLDLYDTVWEYFRKGELSPLPLAFRRHYVEWLAPKPGEPIPVEGLRETAMHDRSAKVRSCVAQLLAKHGELDRKTANVLAKDKDAIVRCLASEYADPHLFFDETDARIVGHMVQIGVADKACFRHWIDSDDAEIQRAAADLADDTTVDMVLAKLSSKDGAIFLSHHRNWATRERVMRAWDNSDGYARCALARVATDVPDSFIDEALHGDGRYAMRDRLEEYRGALRKVAECERLFAEDSEIRRKIQARVKRDMSDDALRRTGRTENHDGQ